MKLFEWLSKRFIKKEMIRKITVTNPEPSANSFIDIDNTTNVNIPLNTENEDTQEDILIVEDVSVYDDPLVKPKRKRKVYKIEVSNTVSTEAAKEILNKAMTKKKE